MQRLSLIRIVPVLFPLALLAGCPLGPTDSTGGTSGIVPDTSSGGTTATGDTTTGGTSTGGDALETKFPGCESPDVAASWRTQVLDLLNRERTSRGLTALTSDAVLEAQAEQYACEMIFYDFFAHDNPVTGTTLRDRADEFGYDYQIVGENLAAGQRSPIEVVTDWMNSPEHRENMLRAEFTEVGIGIRTGGEYGVYWVLEFGTPRS